MMIIAGFAYAGAETRVCFLRTTINNVQITKAATGPVLAEFSYDSIEIVDDNPTVLCLITRGYRAGVYYFDTYEASEPARISSYLCLIITTVHGDKSHS